MSVLSKNVIKEIETLFRSHTKIYKKHSLFLFADFKKGEIRPIIGIPKGMNAQSLALDESIDIKDEFLDKQAAAASPLLKNIFDHFRLTGLHKLDLQAPAVFFMGVTVAHGQQTARDELSLKNMARLVRFILENDYLMRKLTESSDHLMKILNEMSVLHEISRSIDSSHNLDSLLQFIVQEAMQLMNAEAGSLMLVVPDTDEMEFKVAIGPKSDGVKPFRLKIGQGISGWVAQHGRPILIPDAYADPRFDPSFDKRSGFRTRSYLCVPLSYKEKIFGVMTVLNRLDGSLFSESDKELLETFAAQAALAIENAKLLKEALEKERLERELQVAAEIQQRILPDKLPQTESLDMAATYIPAREISGDFYDVFALDAQRLVFVVADVAGKGVPAALLVANMQASLRAYFEFTDDIISVADRLNRKIIAITTADRFITFFFGVYNLAENSFTCVNAGHNPPLLMQNKQDITELKTGGIFLGMMPWQYESQKVLLAENGSLALFTDGLVEAMNSDEEEFGEQRLKALLLENRRMTAGELVDLIVSSVRRHTGGTHLQDDFTLLIVKRKQ